MELTPQIASIVATAPYVENWMVSIDLCSYHTPKGMHLYQRIPQHSYFAIRAPGCILGDVLLQEHATIVRRKLLVGIAMLVR